MQPLTTKALAGLARIQIALAAMLFVPAWSLRYWQGWLFWDIIGACSLAITLYFLRHDPALVERRMRAGPAAERQPSQRRIQAAAAVLICASIVMSALDQRFGWSAVPTPAVFAADAVIVLGFVFIFVVFRENSFAAAVIEVATDQIVIESGPYALIRHPMYAGAILGLVATPVALGSWWGLIPAALLTGVIIWRLVDEEAYLVDHLAGYENYRRRVRWRLMPGVW